MAVEGTEEDLESAVSALMRAMQLGPIEEHKRAGPLMTEMPERNLLAGIGMRLNQMTLPESTRHLAEQMIAEAVETGRESALINAISEGLHEHKQAIVDRTPEAQAVNQGPMSTSAMVALLAARGAFWVRQANSNGWSTEELQRQIEQYVAGHPVDANFTQAQVYQRRMQWERSEYFAVNWFRTGLPRVEVGQRLAASFAATRVLPDVLVDLKMPWPAFLVDIPESLRAGALQSHLITVMEQDYLDRSAFTIRSLQPRRDGFVIDSSLECVRDLSHLAGLAEGREKVETGHQIRPEDRVLLRFLLGAILELNEHRPSQKPSTLQKTKGLPTDRDEPRCTIVRLTRDVKIDAREEIRNYLRNPGTARGPVTVQSIIAGHWKMQPCGKGRAERKRIHVEPYWRGPDDAPIALRNHVLDVNEPTKNNGSPGEQASRRKVNDEA